MATIYETQEIQDAGRDWAQLERVIRSGKYSDERVIEFRKQQDALHEKAERLRSELSYSGGSDGSKVDPIVKTPIETIQDVIITDSNIGFGASGKTDSTLIFALGVLLLLLTIIRK